jgi:hypothetical protein
MSVIDNCLPGFSNWPEVGSFERVMTDNITLW